jgi:hypothetical protein
VGIDWSRTGEVLLILITALAASMARYFAGMVHAQDFAPADAEGARLWWHRFGWAIAGEVAACITFVMVAEAVVIMRGYDGPVGVLLGAAAATLGFPFVAGILRRRVERRVGEGDSQ